jgi:hypothetical protein
MLAQPLREGWLSPQCLNLCDTPQLSAGSFVPTRLSTTRTCTIRRMAVMFSSFARISISGRFQFCGLRENAETDTGYVFGGTVSTGWWWAGGGQEYRISEALAPEKRTPGRPFTKAVEPTRRVRDGRTSWIAWSVKVKSVQRDF